MKEITWHLIRKHPVGPLLKQLREALAEGREAELTASSLGHSIERHWHQGYQQGLRVAIMIVEKQK